MYKNHALIPSFLYLAPYFLYINYVFIQDAEGQIYFRQNHIYQYYIYELGNESPYVHVHMYILQRKQVSNLKTQSGENIPLRPSCFCPTVPRWGKIPGPAL